MIKTIYFSKVVAVMVVEVAVIDMEVCFYNILNDLDLNMA